jgi:4-amino-4-deoxy-L-arabinose transferase-like glycosyltransferase
VTGNPGIARDFSGFAEVAARARDGAFFPPRRDYFMVRRGKGYSMAVTTEREPRRHLSAPNLVTFAARSHLRAGALLVAVCLLTFLPGFFSIPPIDRDEARFAQATKQMLETGDFVDIRFQDETRYKKPVGIYWLQAVVVKAAETVGVPHARTRIWLYRIPSLVGATGAVVLTYWAALAFVSRRASLLAGLMMATCIVLGVEARLAKTDAMLLSTIVLAMGAMGRAYIAEQGTRIDGRHPLALPAIFWTAIAAGVLLKGPLILLFVGLTAGALVAVDRSARWMVRLKPLAGIAWTLALVLPWFLSIVARSGESFFIDSVGKDLLAKVGSSQEMHGAPPGLYFLLFWVTFFPGAILAGLAVPAVWRARSEPGGKFLLAWLVPTWIAFELVVTKLPHYVLPLYPAVAILIAGALDKNMLSRNSWLVRGTVGWFLVAVAAAIAAIGFHILLGQQLGFSAWPFAAGAVIFGLFAWLLYDVDGAERSLLRAAAASILLFFALCGATFPAIRSLFPAVQLADAVRRVDCERPGFASAGYHEPSLVFLVGTETQLTDGAGAADFLNGGACRFAFIEKSQERSFVRRADALGLRYSPSRRVEAVNVSIGRAVSIVIYRSERTSTFQ